MFSIFLIALSFVLTSCHKEAIGLGTGSQLLLAGERPNASFGSTGDLVGDLNGDNFGDVVIGAPGDSRNGADSGTIYIYLGSATGPSKKPASLLAGEAGDRFGTSIAGLESGFAVTSVKASHIGAPTQAAVYLFMGGSIEQASSILTSEGNRELMVSSAGDLDQNGALDLAVADPDADTVYIFFNGSLFPSSSRFTLSQADLILHGAKGSHFGAAIAAVGDINGQNVGLKSRFGDDFAIGAPQEDGKGAAYVLIGKQGFLRGEFQIETIAQKLTGTQSGDEFGASVAGVGDFDGDGFGDLAIGAPGNGAGRVELYFGRSLTGVSTIGPAVFNGESVGDRFGAAVTGFASLIVGAPLNDFTSVDSGSVYLFSNSLFPKNSSLTGVSVNASFANTRIRNSQGGIGGKPQFGSFVKSGSDINGDGVADDLIGIPGGNSAGDHSGSVLVLW